MSEDIIRIGGVEYEQTTACDETYIVKLRRKRVQTGWICRGSCRCKHSPCVTHDRGSTSPPYVHNTLVRCNDATWVPFYGKVVE